MNKKSLLVLAASGLLVLGMTSCGQKGQSSEPASSQQGGSQGETSVPSSEPSQGEESLPSSESSSKTVSKIGKTALPKFKVNDEIDLDDYITVVYADKSEDKNYTITNTDEDLSVEGHILVPTAVKSYSVTVKAGNKSSRVTIDVRSEENFAVAEFLAPLAQNPQNYTVEDFSINSKTGALVYDGTYVHTENYVAIYDKTNPGALDSKGEPDSTIIAQLADGHAYWGYFNAEGNPVFKPGKCSYGDFYITGDLALDGWDFNSTYEEDEETGDLVEVVAAGASANQAFLNYALSQLPDRSGYAYAELEVLGWADLDGDEENETLLIMPWVTKGVDRYYVGVFGIHDIGTSKVDALEDCKTNAAYLPERITADELKTGIANALAANSYTVTINLKAVNEDGSDMTDPTDSIFYLMFDGTTMTSVLTYDANGVHGKLTIDGEEAGELVYFNHEGKAYGSSYESGEFVVSELAGVTDVLTLDDVQEWLPHITGEAVEATDWTGKATVGGNVVMSGNVGDNDGTAEVPASLLFIQAFDAFGWFNWGGDKLGSYLGNPTDGWSGNVMHSLSLYSDWDACWAEANGFTLRSLFYFPFSDDVSSKYGLMEIVVSDAGSTVNDFSGFIAE